MPNVYVPDTPLFQEDPSEVLTIQGTRRGFGALMLLATVGATALQGDIGGAIRMLDRTSELFAVLGLNNENALELADLFTAIDPSFADEVEDLKKKWAEDA